MSGLKLHPAIVVLVLPFVMLLWIAGGAPWYAVALCSTIIISVTFPNFGKRTGIAVLRLGGKLTAWGAKKAYKAIRP